MSIVSEVTDTIFDDDNDADSSDDENTESKLEITYLSPVVGRALGVQPVPRFNIDLIRPFEVMFVDNKDYENRVRGGRQTALLLYDLASTAKFKVDIFRKLKMVWHSVR